MICYVDSSNLKDPWVMGQNFNCADKLKKEDFNFVETKNTKILEFFL
jgi:hypothetical protein